MPVTARILVVRHGESEWNAAGRWQGQADPPLSSRGERQARAAAERVGLVGAIAASDLQRAADTALIIANELGAGPVVVDERLRERHAGEWTGLTRVEIEERFPGYLANRHRPPGWERSEELVRRVVPSLIALAETYRDDNVLAVTHGGVIASLEAHCGLAWAALPNLAGRWFDVVDGVLHAGERVALVDPHDAPVTIPRAE